MDKGHYSTPPFIAATPEVERDIFLGLISISTFTVTFA